MQQVSIPDIPDNLQAIRTAEKYVETHTVVAMELYNKCLKELEKNYFPFEINTEDYNEDGIILLMGKLRRAGYKCSITNSCGWLTVENPYIKEPVLDH